MSMRERLETATLVLLFSTTVWLSFTVLTEASQAKRTVDCQARWNEQYQVLQTQRSQWASEDRDSLTTAIETIAEAQSPDATQLALDNYLKVVRDNDKKRAEAKVPQIPKDCEDVISPPDEP